MSKLSKYGRRQKDQFRRELEEYQEDEIDLKLRQFEEQENEDIRRDLEELEYLRMEDLSDEAYDFDDWDYEEIYDYHYYEPDWDDYEDVYGEVVSPGEIGTYYKDKENRTLLCCKIDYVIRYINVHTGLEVSVNPFVLEKIA
jgi:hypothetical protein